MGAKWTQHENNTLTQLWEVRGYSARVCARALDRSEAAIYNQVALLGLKKKLYKKEVVQLRKDGLTFKQIGTILGISTNSASGIHAQAKKVFPKPTKRKLIPYAGASCSTN